MELRGIRLGIVTRLRHCFRHRAIGFSRFTALIVALLISTVVALLVTVRVERSTHFCATCKSLLRSLSVAFHVAQCSGVVHQQSAVHSSKVQIDFALCEERHEWIFRDSSRSSLVSGHRLVGETSLMILRSSTNEVWCFATAF